MPFGKETTLTIVKKATHEEANQRRCLNGEGPQKLTRQTILEETKTDENDHKSEDKNNFKVVPDWEMIVVKKIKNKKITPISHLLCHW